MRESWETARRPQFNLEMNISSLGHPFLANDGNTNYLRTRLYAIIQHWCVESYESNRWAVGKTHRHWNIGHRHVANQLTIHSTFVEFYLSINKIYSLQRNGSANGTITCNFNVGLEQLERTQESTATIWTYTRTSMSENVEEEEEKYWMISHHRFVGCARARIGHINTAMVHAKYLATQNWVADRHLVMTKTKQRRKKKSTSFAIDRKSSIFLRSICFGLCRLSTVTSSVSSFDDSVRRVLIRLMFALNQINTYMPYNVECTKFRAYVLAANTNRLLITRSMGEQQQ